MAREWLQKLEHAMTYFMDVCGPPVIGRGKQRLYTLHSYLIHDLYALANMDPTANLVTVVAATSF